MYKNLGGYASSTLTSVKFGRLLDSFRRCLRSWIASLILGMSPRAMAAASTGKWLTICQNGTNACKLIQWEWGGGGGNHWVRCRLLYLKLSVTVCLNTVQFPTLTATAFPIQEHITFISTLISCGLCSLAPPTFCMQPSLYYTTLQHEQVAVQ